MMSKKKTNLLVAMGLACAMSGAAIAAEGENDAYDGKSAPAGVVGAHLLASQLMDYGRANGDALALVTAAQMMKAAPARDASRDKTSEGGQESADKAGSGAEYTVEAALASATEIGGNNPTIAGLIGDVRAATGRGRTQGPARHVDRVKARSVDVYNVSFDGGERAQIGVRGDGDTDLDLYVYDENGNEICRDTDRTDRMYCTWTPRWTGTFEVKIKNYGDVYNQYTLLTN